jgi:hypothetical protein
MSTAERPHRIQQAEALRRLADFVEQNPEFEDVFLYTFNNINVFPRGDKKAQIAEFVRAGLRSGARVEKRVIGDWFAATLHFGAGVDIDVTAQRDEVCERVVTGTKTVTKTVPDPEALATVPTVEVTEEIEQVEWVCRPLLAAEKNSSATSLTPELLAEAEHWAANPLPRDLGATS